MRRIRLRLEGLWWMTRPASLLTGFIAVPGWLAADTGGSGVDLVATTIAVSLGRATANIVNDILDEPKDEVTAPELPLPSGVVTVAQAALTVGTLSILMLLLLVMAAPDLTAFAGGVAGIVAGGLVYGSYSFVKDRAGLAMLVTGVSYACAPLAAWLVAGGSWSAEIVVVLIYALLRGLAANVFSTLRDVDRDSVVGNWSIAVRLGVKRALLLALGLECLATLLILVVAAERNHLDLGILVVLVSLSLFAVSYMSAQRGHERANTREARISLMWPVNTARNYAGIVIVQSLSTGIVVAVATVTVRFVLVPAYRRRILEGKLAEALGDAGALTGERRPPRPA